MRSSLPRLRIAALGICLAVLIPQVDGQASSPHTELTVAVVNAHADPAQPVEGARVSLSFVAGSENVVVARDATNRAGQALLLVSQEAAQRGDLRVEISGVSDLVIYEPADGQLTGNLKGLSLTVQFKLLPKGDPALMGPAQIYAMLHRLSLQSKQLQQQNRELKTELADAQGQKPDDLTDAIAAWAKANGLEEKDAERKIQEWAEEIQRDKQQASEDQKALAELALKHYGAAAQLFNQAANDIGASMDDDEKRFLEERRTRMRELVDKSIQSSNAFHLDSKYHQATQTLEQARDRATAEHGHFPEDAALRDIWLEAVYRAAYARVDEGEIAPGSDSVTLLARSVDDFRGLLADYVGRTERQGWAQVQCNLGATLDDQAARSTGTQATNLSAQAVEAFRAALTVQTKAGLPQDWAATQVDLGNALTRQGERMGGAQATELLAQAVAAYRSALEILTKADMNWGMTQSNLGVALTDEGGRATGAQAIDLLAQALVAFRAALEVRTRTELPQDWAATETNLGNALRRQAELSGGAQAADLLVQATAAYHAALEVFTKADMPQYWAMTQTALGVALTDEGERASGAQAIDLLAQAVEAYRGALEVYTEGDLPQEWAETQSNLGNALKDQAERANGAQATDLLAQAVEAYRSALEVFTKANLPQNWAMTQNNLGVALVDQAKLSSGVQASGLLTQSIEAYRAALEVRTKADLPQDWGATQNNLGYALKIQRGQSNSPQATDLLAQEIAAYRAALQVYAKADQPKEWAWTESSLGNALMNQGEQSSGAEGTDLLAQAAAAYRAALEVYTKADPPQDWAATQNNLGYTLTGEGERSTGAQATSFLNQAVEAYRAALEIYTKADLPKDWVMTQFNLERALADEGDVSGASSVLDGCLDAFPANAQVLLRAETIYHDKLFRYDRAYEVTEHLTQLDASPASKLDLVEADLTTSRFDDCVKQALAIDDASIPPPAMPMLLIRDTMKQACQWGAGQKTAAQETDKALLPRIAQLEKAGWEFAGTLHYLATSPAFADGRTSWVALFQGLENGNSAAMTASLDQLEEVMKH